jgi:acetyl-CoA carboxylase biotin carboxyl carrier protein
MNPEEIKELKELVEFLKESKIGEFDLERGEFKVRIKFAQEHSAADLANLGRLLAGPHPHVPAAQASAVGPIHAADAANDASADEEDGALHIVKSPIVGTFYESPSPGTAAFVSVGDHVENGQVLCIVEAMKLMNEIESDAAGEIVKRFVQSGQAIEYGQPLFAVRLA